MHQKPFRLSRKGTKFKALQQEVLERDGRRCNICGEIVDGHPAHHIVYYSSGGQDIPENMCGCCANCHYIIHHGTIDNLIPLIINYYGRKHLLRYFLQGVVAEKESGL